MNGPVKGQAYHLQVNGVPTYLIAGAMIEADAPVYSSDDALNGRVYTFFSLAALELAKKLDWRPDIVHANDWHTALSVYALKTMYATDAFFQGVHTILSVHNLPFMGAGSEGGI